MNSLQCMGPLYGQDVIAPVFVGHGLDFGDYGEEGGEPGHLYNYLGYAFREGDSYAEAIAYLDEPGRVTLRILEPADLSGDFAQRVLVFLSMRFETVLAPAGDGNYAPLDGALKAEIYRLKAAHMKAAAV